MEPAQRAERAGGAAGALVCWEGGGRLSLPHLDAACTWTFFLSRHCCCHCAAPPTPLLLLHPTPGHAATAASATLRLAKPKTAADTDGVLTSSTPCQQALGGRASRPRRRGQVSRCNTARLGPHGSFLSIHTLSPALFATTRLLLLPRLPSSLPPPPPPSPALLSPRPSPRCQLPRLLRLLSPFHVELIFLQPGRARPSAPGGEREQDARR